MTDIQALIENRPPSVAVLFQERVAATPDAEAYRYPVPAALGEGPDHWASLTWYQAAQRVDAIAAGLIELGVQPEQRVALASATRLEWILADLAKARERWAELPGLTHVVVIDPAGADLSEERTLSLAELERRGAEYLEKSPRLIKERVGELTRDQLATLIYTSGTTGRSKGVRLRHDSWSYMAKATASWLETEWAAGVAL